MNPFMRYAGRMVGECIFSQDTSRSQPVQIWCPYMRRARTPHGEAVIRQDLLRDTLEIRYTGSTVRLILAGLKKYPRFDP